MKKITRILSGLTDKVAEYFKEEDVNGATIGLELHDSPVVENLLKINETVLLGRLNGGNYKRYVDGSLNTVIMLSDVTEAGLNSEDTERMFRIIRKMGKNGIFHLAYAYRYGDTIEVYYLLNGDTTDSSENLTNIVSYMSAMKREGAYDVEVTDMHTNGSSDKMYTYLIKFVIE